MPDAAHSRANRGKTAMAMTSNVTIADRRLAIGMGKILNIDGFDRLDKDLSYVVILKRFADRSSNYGCKMVDCHS